MRIIGGIYRGRKLADFSEIGVRPTSDMARESLFNILRNDIPSARVLDLFCGTGAFGLEALSRGAEFVTFNDCSRKSIELLKKNLSTLKIEQAHEIKSLDGISLLKGVVKPYDVIFLDPPYGSEFVYRAVEESVKVLADDGVVILENDNPQTVQVSGARVVDNRRYGKAYFTFYKKEL